MSMLMSRCSLTSKVDVVVFVVLLQQSRRRGASQILCQAELRARREAALKVLQADWLALRPPHTQSNVSITLSRELDPNGGHFWVLGGGGLESRNGS